MTRDDAAYDASAISLGNETPLHIACAAIDIDLKLVEFLLSHGADPNIMPQDCPSPFAFLLIFNPELEAVQKFISHGANCSQVDAREWTPMHYLGKWGTDGKLVSLIRRNGGEVNAKDNRGKTPLHNMLQRDEMPMDLLLSFLDEGADISIDDKDSQSKLYMIHYNWTFGVFFHCHV